MSKMDSSSVPSETQQRNTITIYDKRWFFRLNRSEDDSDCDTETNSQPSQRTRKKSRGLLDEISLRSIDGHLVVCMITPTEHRLFTFFDSFLDFALYQQKIVPEKRYFYEIAFGEYPQKPHFDIDIAANPNDVKDIESLGEQIKDSLIEQVIKIYADRSVDLDLQRDILVYTSHGPSKRSYHLVVNNYCHVDYRDARCLYEKVMLSLPDSFSSYIDRAVYSKKQQFRIVGSQKFESGRPKVFQKQWTYFGQLIDHLYNDEPDTPDSVLQLDESLISYTSNCNVLPSLFDASESKSQPKSSRLHDVEDVSRRTAEQAVILLASQGGLSPSDRRFPYRFDGIHGGIVCLKRLKPSRCSICNRVHDHENPYLVILGEGPRKTIYFHCRRAPDSQKLLLGHLDVTLPNTIETKNTPKVISDPTGAAKRKEQELISWCSSVEDRVKKMTEKEPDVPSVKKPWKDEKIDPAHQKKMLDNTRFQLPYI